MYVVQADDNEPEEVGTFWAAYWRADELRSNGAKVVRVFPSRKKSKPVFALIEQSDTQPEDRASNTVDPGMWDTVMELTRDK